MNKNNTKALQNAVNEMEEANQDGLALLAKVQDQLADFDLRYKKKLVNDNLKVLKMAKDILENEEAEESES